MGDPAVVTMARQYLAAVRRAGISATRAVLFGSYARGASQADNDVDIQVIAPEFDEPEGRSRTDVLWALRANTDSRIEPFAVGKRQWREDAVSVIIEMTRREGLETSA